MENSNTILFDDSTYRAVKLCRCDRELIDDAMVMYLGEEDTDKQVQADAMTAKSLMLATLDYDNPPKFIQSSFMMIACLNVIYVLSERQICAVRAILVAFQVSLSETLQSDHITDEGAKGILKRAEKARKLARHLAQPVSSNS